jgi:hypothetical protein
VTESKLTDYRDYSQTRLGVAERGREGLGGGELRGGEGDGVPSPTRILLYPRSKLPLSALIMSSVLTLTSTNAKAAAALELPELTAQTRFVLSVADLCELGCFVKSVRVTKEDGTFTREPTGDKYVDLRIPLERFLSCIREVPEAAKVPDSETVVSRRGTGKDGSPKASSVEVPAAQLMTEEELEGLLEKFTPHPRRAKFDELLFREYGRGPADFSACYKQYVAYAETHHPLAQKKAASGSGSEEDAASTDAPVKRGRGRPKKVTTPPPAEVAPVTVPVVVPVVVPEAAAVTAPVAAAEKKPRGRPKKVVTPPASAPVATAVQQSFPAPAALPTTAALASLLDEVEDC